MADEPTDDEGPPGDREADDAAPPLSDLADRVRDRHRAEPGDTAGTAPGDRELDPDGLFREQPVTEIDAGKLWESIDSDWPYEADARSAGDEAEHVVPKRWYCEQCEYFATPPAAHCTHPGTSIVEFVDTDHVRVRNCPVVVERQALGEFRGEDPPSTSPD